MRNISKSVLTLLIVFVASAGLVNAQSETQKKFPKVFLIGEYEEFYNSFVEQYPESLLKISNDSMELAYVNWMYLLKDMEEHSKKINFDLNGLKIWINVFWNKDGGIDYITYYPRPNSRNMDFDKLTAFFIDFIKKYNVRYKGDSNFVHYGSARFPSFADMYIPQSE